MSALAPSPRSLRIISYFAVLLLWGCGLNAPENWNDAVSLMARYNSQGLHNDAIRVGEQWIKNHPEDHEHDSLFYGQIAITYLIEASKDRRNRKEWIRHAIEFYERDLSVNRIKNVY